MTQQTDKPRICFISVSEVPSDPRVRRHGDSLCEAGWDVTAIGINYREATKGLSVPRWPYKSTQFKPNLVATRAHLASAYAANRLLPISNFWYWLIPPNRALYKIGRDIKADIYVANDWATLPIAFKLAKAHGGRVVYDSHEHAISENDHSPRARILLTPMARWVENQYVARCDAVMTVSSPIAHALQQQYGLLKRPTLIRNMSRFSETEPSKTEGEISVLYHGVYARNRGLLHTIKSVVHWPAHMHLTVRGYGVLETEMRELVQQLNLGNRITFASPVHAHEIIQAAKSADIGLCPMPGDTQHNRGALPNKFFEYVQAGLGVFSVADSPDVTELTEKHSLGWICTNPDPLEIAARLGSISNEEISAAKAASCKAAKTLSWEANDEKQLISLMQGVSNSAK